MLSFDDIALELLEYKLTDLQAEREVRGGVQSAWELYYHLSQDVSSLNAELRRSVEGAGRRLKALNGVASQPRDAHDTFEALVIENFGVSTNPDVALDDRGNSFILNGVLGLEPQPKTDSKLTATAVLSTDPPLVEEQRLLQRLAQDVWWHEVEELMQQLAVRSRVEKDRATARLLYALLRNIERYSQDEHFSDDIGLEHFMVEVAVADHNDPLVSLNDVDTLTELTREIIGITMSLGDVSSPYPALHTPRRGALEYVERMAQKIAQNPYAGKLSLMEQHGPSSEQLRMLLKETAREPMRADEQRARRQELERRLQLTLEQERKQRELFVADVKRFSLLTERFFTHLRAFLPSRVGGQADDPGLAGGVLFAENPALRIDSVAPSAQAVTVNMKGPLRFSLGGLELALTGASGNRALFVGEQEYALLPELKIDLLHRKLFGFLKGNYLHLRLVENERSLALVLAEALSVLDVLRSAEREAVLDVLAKATNTSVADPQARVLRSLARLSDMSRRAPQRRTALEGLLRGAAKAKNLQLSKRTLQSVVDSLLNAMTVRPEDLTSVLSTSKHSEVHMHTLNDEPVKLRVGGQPVTVRKYRGRSQSNPSVVVMLPGRIIGTFAEQTVQPFPGGTLLAVKSRDKIALLFYKGVQI